MPEQANSEPDDEREPDVLAPDGDGREPDDGFKTESETRSARGTRRSADQVESEEQRTEPADVEPEGFPTEPEA
jgi:hypothetical protein